MALAWRRRRRSPHSARTSPSLVAARPGRGIASARIRAAAGRGATVATFMADLSSQASVRRLAAEVLARYPKLEVLVNNAGAMYGTRQLTKDGIELTWAVNHLAPFLLTFGQMGRPPISSTLRFSAIPTRPAATLSAILPM